MEKYEKICKLIKQISFDEFKSSSTIKESAG